MLKYIVLGLLILSSVATIEKLRKNKGVSEDNWQWFNGQLLDHRDMNNQQTWSQRYWVYDQYFNPSNGVVLYHICGEYTCTGVPEERQWPLQLAQKLGGLVVVLEHRYYGQSMPLPHSLKTENLVYLTVENALEDLAYFQNYFIQNQMSGVTSNIPWIAIGGSYPGALSAWYRIKYPFLVIGALSASGVVNSIYNFTSFDYQVYNSSARSTGTEEDCPIDLRLLNDFVEQTLQDETKARQLKSQFNATNLTNEEFLYYFADTIAERVQYGGREQQCKEVTSALTELAMLQTVIDYANANGATPYGYGSYYLSNYSFFEGTDDASRAWTYQFCTEFGWFQPFSPVDRVRAKGVTLQSLQNLCKNSFNIDFSTYEMSNNTNIYFGGNKLSATNLIMSNGYEDPWKWAGITTPTPQLDVLLIDCNNCGHCVDLYTPQDSDDQNLKNARSKELYLMAKWINEYYQSLGLTYKMQDL